MKTLALPASLVGLLSIVACTSSSTPERLETATQAWHGCSDGAVRDAEDGCNTCTCADGHWQCTEIACEAPPTPAPAACIEGQVKSAGDDCNFCTCENGAWQCTELACEPTAKCVDGDEKTLPDGNWCHCEDGVFWCTQLTLEP